MQGEAAADSRGREDAHHEGVSGMMEVISTRSPLPSTGGGHRLLFHGVVGAFPCQAQRLLGWITICISILATLHPLAGNRLSAPSFISGVLVCTDCEREGIFIFYFMVLLCSFCFHTAHI
ncbi:hypothetical protein VPH35_007398 [Triticum aestivum]